MGVTTYGVTSPFAFLMSVLWFSLLILLSLLTRKLRYPIRFSVLPLFGLLALSVLRMLLPAEMPGAVIVVSKTLLPAIIGFLRTELPGLSVSVIHLLIAIWITIAVLLLTRDRVKTRRGRRAAREVFKLLESSRDLSAEALLAEIIAPKRLPQSARVYRTKHVKVPKIIEDNGAYILLPEMDFSEKELRAILTHEWKHYSDRDFPVRRLTDIVCRVFWWNPLVYLLRRNLRLAQELKCDFAAMSVIDGDVDAYLAGLWRILDISDDSPEPANALTGVVDTIEDRVETLRLHEKSPRKQRLVNIVFWIIALALLGLSYMFIIQPAYPVEESGTALSEDSYIAGENYVVDNGDGTYSLYIDGQFVMESAGNNEKHPHLPMRKGAEG